MRLTALVLVALIGCERSATPPTVATTAQDAAALERDASPTLPRVSVSLAPDSVAGVLHDARSGDSVELAAWARDATRNATARYAALRQLEQLDTGESLTVATELLESDSVLLRHNAIGVLARSPSPRARAALARLTPADRRIARFLSARRR